MLSGYGHYAEPMRGEAATGADKRMIGADKHTIATPLGCRLMRIIRLPRGWRLWTATRDFKYGSYIELFDDGRVLNCTSRVDEGDEVYWCRPSDEELSR
jgi:hypothetical protein